MESKSKLTAVELSFSGKNLHVTLADGRVISAPLAWFPRLLAATPKQRAKWEFIGGGIGIHWPAIDEDISIESLLQPHAFMRAKDAAPSRKTKRTGKK
jgi:hypothetical protein